MLFLLFKRARLLARGKTLSCHSRALQAALELKENEQVLPEDFLRLDDSEVWSSIKIWAEDESGDPILRDLARRLLSRKLFKVFFLSGDIYNRLRDVDSPAFGHNLRALVRARLNCSFDDAEYYYAFDSTTFNVIGRPQTEPRREVWILESGALGFEFKTLREYWEKEFGPLKGADQCLLLVHPDVVQDLAGIVSRMSFPSESVKARGPLPDAPDPYALVAPLGREGAWKEVYAAANTKPGSTPEKIVALKRYKTVDIELGAIERDVAAINLLAVPHPNLSSPRLLRHEGGETWILEPLWTGSLEDLLKKQGPRRDILEIFEIAQQLFSGLAQLHAYGLRHTDIKPDNCGILATGLREKTYVLGDFGCLSSSPDKLPPDPRLLGTLRTRAPEVIARNRISLKSDVWSMASTLYALCCMEYPFMPFDAPHHDSSDRAERERSIKCSITALVGQHREKVGLLLPPVLSRELAPCFEEEESRLSAEEAFESFRSKHAELVNRKDALFRTAWQRAEDITHRFGAPHDLLRGGFLADKRRKEVEQLMTTYEDFVPSQIRTSLARLISGL
jgi:serine/threonine protein kinase